MLKRWKDLTSSSHISYCVKILIWIAVSFVVTACSQQNTTTLAIPTESMEEPFYAWDFSMESISGTTYTLSELRDQWVIINFWATWCIPCVKEMPVLQEIHDQYTDLTVLGINQRETKDEIQSFSKEHKINFPILVNPSDQVLVDYNVIGLPQTLVVNPDGIIVWRQFGPVLSETFSETITEFLGE